MALQQTTHCDRPACKACKAAMQIARLELRPQQPTDLQVFVCSDCGLYQLARPKISTRTAA